MTGAGSGARWPLFALAGGCLLAAGGGIGYWLRPSTVQPASMEATLERPAASATNPQASGSHAHGQSITAESESVVVRLSPEMAARAGIRTTAVAAGQVATQIRLPGVIQPDAYREVTVTSVIAGRVSAVHAELGQHVASGAPLATVYSPEIAEAQMAFLAARADQQAHEQRQIRTQRLVAIGAASREELELHQADRVRIDAAVEIARSRLALIGIPDVAQRLSGPGDVVTSAPVRAPLGGVVTRRTVNVGLNVVPSTPLFTLVDLSTVWVIGDLYEKDFARVRVGSPAMVTVAAYPGVTIAGRVAYIDPQVQPETRTAKLRVEVPNASGSLRLGMFVNVEVGDAEPRRGVLVPKASVQMVGGDSVVYLSAGDGTFVERPVRVDGAAGDQVLVTSGLVPGDQVVEAGAFFVRAERERQHAQ